MNNPLPEFMNASWGRGKLALLFAFGILIFTLWSMLALTHKIELLQQEIVQLLH
jgi:hypothetical protein